MERIRCETQQTGSMKVLMKVLMKYIGRYGGFSKSIFWELSAYLEYTQFWNLFILISPNWGHWLTLIIKLIKILNCLFEDRQLWSRLHLFWGYSYLIYNKIGLFVPSLTLLSQPVWDCIGDRSVALLSASVQLTKCYN